MIIFPNYFIFFTRCCIVTQSYSDAQDAQEPQQGNENGPGESGPGQAGPGGDGPGSKGPRGPRSGYGYGHPKRESFVHDGKHPDRHGKGPNVSEI